MEEKAIAEVYSRERYFILMKHYKEMSSEIKSFYPDENKENLLFEAYDELGSAFDKVIRLEAKYQAEF
ncbi:MAG: hypothetical protein ACTTG8_07885 [Catonella sp.]|uniref:hypothetical protein n=1 Tax=Catonella sp. TaxID=2382125 RepID=UPI003F9F1270